MTVRNRLLVGSAWVFLGKIITTGLVLLVNVLLSRLLTPEELGAYYLVVSFVTIVAMIGQLGLNRAVVKLVAESLAHNEHERAWGIVRVVAVVGLIGALAIAVILQLGVFEWFATVVFSSNQMISVAVAASIWVGVFSFQGLLAETFRGLHKIRLATLFSGLSSAFVSAGLFAVVWFFIGEADLNEVVLLSLVAGITSVTLAGLILVKDYKKGVEAEHVRISGVLIVALPMFITGLTLFGVREVHMWILGASRPDEDVALYGACAKLINLLAMPLLIVNAVIPPIVAELNAKKKKRELERVLRSSATMASILAGLGFIIVTIWGAEILRLVFGDYYGQARDLFSILAAVTVVDVISGSPGVLLMMTGYERIVMRCAVISGLMGVLASIIFINIMGVTGVGVGVGVSVILNNFGTWYFSRIKVGINTHAGWVPLVAMYRWFHEQCEYVLNPSSSKK